MDDTGTPVPYIPWEGAQEYARLELERYRWKSGEIRCPACGSKSPIYKQRRDGVDGYYRCAKPHSATGKPFVFTVRTDTILEHSHVSLDRWLYSFQLLSQYPRSGRAKDSISAANLASLIDVTRKTALSVLNHIDQLWNERLSRHDENLFLRRLMNKMAKETLFPPTSHPARRTYK